MTPQVFHEEILPAATPVVMRGLAASWPVVRAARESPEAFCAYLKRFDRGAAVPSILGPPGINGRFFYNQDMTGFNFQATSTRVGAALDFLLEHRNDERPPSLAIQSAPARSIMPGFEAENGMPLLADRVEPRLWIGNRVTIAAHHDNFENIACVAAGRRRFTLFPPEQIANLYIGPFELTPAGATISMVSFDNPDLERFPRFEAAMQAALTADLDPGDGIFIPYMWWHHVRSLDAVNMLVNYWWMSEAEARGPARDAFLHALIAIRSLPKPHREAWRALFDHYVFEDDGPAGSHLPAERRGVLGDPDPHLLKALRANLVRNLSRA
ncbi:MAG TPA: cupin-like domain-containing protein [Caulobacteraceae bacterium]|nr:cupin-like domain-containing protein [Caulobacteraceae bacterium]